jgi:hypothetical protein
MEEQHTIQAAFNTQEEIEKMVIQLTAANATLFNAACEKIKEARNIPEYKGVATGCYMILQSVGHLIDTPFKNCKLPDDPVERSIRVAEIVAAIRAINIGRVGCRTANLLPLPDSGGKKIG